MNIALGLEGEDAFSSSSYRVLLDLWLTPRLCLAVLAYGTQVCVGTECKATVTLRKAHLAWCAVLVCVLVVASCLRACRAPKEVDDVDDVNPKYHHHGRDKKQVRQTEKPQTPRIPSGLSTKELKDRQPDAPFLTDDEVSYLRNTISREVCRCAIS